MTEWLELFKRLCATSGVSGFEDEVAAIVRSHMSKLTDTVGKDQMGNVFGAKKGSAKNGPTIMVTAHMDEVGLIVKHVEETGFFESAEVGWRS